MGVSNSSDLRHLCLLLRMYHSLNLDEQSNERQHGNTRCRQASACLLMGTRNNKKCNPPARTPGTSANFGCRGETPQTNPIPHVQTTRAR